MKKKIVCLLPLLLLPFLTSCEDDKVALTYGTYIKTTVFSLNEITTSQLLTKAKDEKEVFLLAVYQGEYSQECLCWTTFENVIAKYINTYHEVVYTYDGQTQDDSIKQLNIEKIDASTPCLYVFNGEKKVSKFSYANETDKAIFEDTTAEAMYTRLHKVIDKPTLCYADDDYLRASLPAIDRTMVLFARSGCGDCKYVIPNVLIPYIHRHHFDNPIYIFDMQKIYDKARNEFATEEDKAHYQEVKDYYGLSEKGNEVFGYQVGVVPSMQYLEKGVVKSMAVYFNDTIAQKEDGTFYIADSYYTKERLPYLKYLKGSNPNVLKDMTLKDGVLKSKNGYYWSQEAASKYHKPLFEAFLDYYIY